MEYGINVNPDDNSVQKKGLSLIDPSLIWGACLRLARTSAVCEKLQKGWKIDPVFA